MLVLGALRSDIYDIFSNSRNSPGTAARKFAEAVDRYLMRSHPPTGGVAISGQVKNILRPILESAWSNVHTSIDIAAGIISSGIASAAYTIVYQGPCFGTGSITFFNQSMLKQGIIRVWSSTYPEPNLPSTLLASAIHATCVTAIATGSGYSPPHPCTGPQVGVIF